MQRQPQLLRGSLRFVAVILGLLALAESACSRAPLQPMGTGNGNTVTPYSGGNPYTPVNPQATINTTNGTNCSGGGSSSNGTCYSWDQSGALSVLNGINPINPAQSSVGSDLQNGIASLLQQASKNGAAAAEQDCSMYPDALTAIAHQCFNRYMLGGEILKQCGANLEQYKPLPGEPLVGDYDVSCYGIKASITGDYPGYTVHFQAPLPQLPKSIAVSMSDPDTIKYSGTGSLGTLHYQFSFTDLPTAASGTYSSSNPAVPTKCSGGISMSHSNNPIPAKVAQGMKSLSDCERKVMLLMSPLFDTMFNNMQGQNGQPNPAMSLMLAAMNIGN